MFSRAVALSIGVLAFLGVHIASGAIEPHPHQDKREFRRSLPDAYLMAEDKRHGLSLRERQALYRQIILAERRSIAEADREYPGRGVQNARYANRLLKQYRADLAKKYGITGDQLVEVMNEGIRNKWPSP